jgi:hypothetical protein
MNNIYTYIYTLSQRINEIQENSRGYIDKLHGFNAIFLTLSRILNAYASAIKAVLQAMAKIDLRMSIIKLASDILPFSEASKIEVISGFEFLKISFFYKIAPPARRIARIPSSLKEAKKLAPILPKSTAVTSGVLIMQPPALEVIEGVKTVKTQASKILEVSGEVYRTRIGIEKAVKLPRLYKATSVEVEALKEITPETISLPPQAQALFKQAIEAAIEMNKYVLKVSKASKLPQLKAVIIPSPGFLKHISKLQEIASETHILPKLAIESSESAARARYTPYAEVQIPKAIIPRAEKVSEIVSEIASEIVSEIAEKIYYRYRYRYRPSVSTVPRVIEPAVSKVEFAILKIPAIPTLKAMEHGLAIDAIERFHWLIAEKATKAYEIMLIKPIPIEIVSKRMREEAIEPLMAPVISTTPLIPTAPLISPAIQVKSLFSAISAIARIELPSEIKERYLELAPLVSYLWMKTGLELPEVAYSLAAEAVRVTELEIEKIQVFPHGVVSLSAYAMLFDFLEAASRQRFLIEKTYKMEVEKVIESFRGGVIERISYFPGERYTYYTYEPPPMVFPAFKLKEIIPLLQTIAIPPAKIERPAVIQRPLNITINVESPVDEDDLRELRRKIERILREEARRHGVSI